MNLKLTLVFRTIEVICSLYALHLTSVFLSADAELPCTSSNHYLYSWKLDFFFSEMPGRKPRRSALGVRKVRLLLFSRVLMITIIQICSVFPFSSKVDGRLAFGFLSHEGFKTKSFLIWNILWDCAFQTLATALTLSPPQFDPSLP